LSIVDLKDIIIIIIIFPSSSSSEQTSTENIIITMIKKLTSTTCMLLVLVLFSLALKSSHGFINSNNVKAKLFKNQRILNDQDSSWSSSSIGLYEGCMPLNNNNKDITTTRRQQRTKLGATSPIIAALTKSIFSYQGNVPLSQAFALNAFLFTILRTKLLKMLTVEGFFHSLFLGTVLWTTIGWRGWTTCVVYLLLGSVSSIAHVITSYFLLFSMG
jgi:hypothetical protein